LKVQTKKLNQTSSFKLIGADGGFPRKGELDALVSQTEPDPGSGGVEEPTTPLGFK